MLSIAHQMRSAGHTVTFAGFTLENIKNLITANGFRPVSIRPSLSSLGFLLLPFTSGYVETFTAINLFFSGLSHYTRAISNVLDEIRPDAVVSDFSFVGACLAAERKNIPHVIIYHAGLSFKGPGIPPFGSGLPIGEAWGQKGRLYRFMSDFLEHSVDNSIAHTRRQLRLAPVEKGYLACPSSPWLTLVLTAEVIEAPRFPLPPTIFFVGPCTFGRQNLQKNDFPFDQLSTDKPKVYVLLGTVFNGKSNVFNKIINAFAGGHYQLIISAGGAFPRLRSQRLPPNIILFEGVPQIEVLSHVDVVISHGGNNTVNETLAAGKPLLVMPVGGEQGDNASKVVYLGVGLRANISGSTPQEIGAKVRRLIEEPAFRQRAREVAKALALTDGPVTAARFIEYVAKNRQPVLRPEGYPLTVTRETVPPWEFKGKG
ncbi:MAG TPA: glycosyltransferase [Candidatus Avalokitesvara rifleensis]|uniref:glycosyltransferase n=1 Tax=Candidatus Avalokitesvara rifleensis TaxID=3367620 RepID=UPI004025A68C